ncbi:C-type lectin domain family 2 member B-like [Chiroxiphia lanceolata]|uniref:C-type lectin domain family 2 member B-like n=1 Tax=Chiroxiphia lanceolata TaxID=296741 RepID=UPI0013CECA88|nr:C-type lectin domain family 2 member B-like [Chiroxiphia lanceolata]XP_032533039.1 C-type lectin domain family 2 member B-like [Chiroxiphia lanceolata]
MGKGTQRPNSSSQEEALNTCSDPEKESKCGSSRTESDQRTSPKVHVLLALCVLLGILSLSLAGAVTVLSVRPRFSELEFSHVCPDTWLGFQEKCYYFSEAEGNWTTGRERCEALGASLATISTREELAFLLRYKGEANHWIGLGKRDNGWEWINGTALNGRFEVRGEGPCGYLSYGWISSSLCHTEKNWICSRPDDYELWKGKLRDPKTGVSP